MVYVTHRIWISYERNCIWISILCIRLRKDKGHICVCVWKGEGFPHECVLVFFESSVISQYFLKRTRFMNEVSLPSSIGPKSRVFIFNNHITYLDITTRLVKGPHVICSIYYGNTFVIWLKPWFIVITVKLTLENICNLRFHIRVFSNCTY